MDNLVKNALLAPFNLLYKISPEAELKLMFRLKQGYSLNLDNPKTYNEKIQWIKLYDHNPLMTKCCDKYAVRSYVEGKGLGHLLNTLLWSGFEPQDIPFDDLPEKFVIKATHGSTFNIICTDRVALDREKIIQVCRRWLDAKFLKCYGEWFYGVEKPRIIIEEYLNVGSNGQLRDYKFYCFNGVPKLIEVDSDRFSGHKCDLYDCAWNKLEGVRIKFPNTDYILPRPVWLDDAIHYAQVLSAPFNHARIDFYLLEDRVVFGEITFTSGAGFSRITPMKLDEEMGGWLVLPEKPVEY